MPQTTAESNFSFTSFGERLEAGDLVEHVLLDVEPSRATF